MSNISRFTIRSNSAHWIPYTTFNYGTSYLTARNNDDNDKETWFLLDQQDPVTGGYQIPTLTPEQLYNMDSKIDDGKPATGKVIAGGSPTGYGAAPYCVDDSSSLNANYSFSEYRIACVLAYYLY